MQELAPSHAHVVANDAESLDWPHAAPTLVGCIVNPRLDATCSARPADAPVGAVAIVAALSLLLLARRAGPTLNRLA